MSLQHVSKTFQFGNQKVTLETGRIARQAAGAVMVTMGNAKVLAAVTVGAAREEFNFMPLTVHYQERFYASGRIPGSFFRREGRPSEKETLTSRLIDRPVRPLFPKGFRNETLVVCTVMSADEQIEPDVPAMLGASAALAVAGIPWQGPIAAARVGMDRESGLYLLNPSAEQLAASSLDMMVAGTDEAVLMVESEADQLSEDQMLGGVLYAHQEMQLAIKSIRDLAAESGVPRWDWQPPAEDSTGLDNVRQRVGSEIEAAYRITDKRQRLEKLNQLRVGLAESADADEATALKDAFGAFEKRLVRERVLAGEPRIDGRDLTSVRPIDVEVGGLPGAHGSSMFTRGETQVIGTVTLGTMRDAQLVDSLEGRTDDPFMLHYNFPPYCVGEAGRMAPPGRREIGHGRLARRGLAALLPSQEDFPYTVRVVGEVTESNGSSSMATVCASSLALMDAGVPVKGAAAGVAMGLVKEGDKFAVLTDILGDEDHLGDMDFKVVGSADGVTALQMDIKIAGITEAIMEQALEQARQARQHILGEMNKVIEAPRDKVADHAPSLEVIQIPVDKIREVIGKGGETIRAITLETGANVDIEQDGTVKVYGSSRESLDQALERIKALTTEVEVGQIFEGTVRNITDFGAFVNIQPGKDGLVHISQIAHERVNNVADYLNVGDKVRTKVIGVDEMGRIKLSIKALDEEGGGEYSAPPPMTDGDGEPIAAMKPAGGMRPPMTDEEPMPPMEAPMVGDIYEGTVTKIVPFGIFVNLFPGKDGLVHISEIAPQRIDNIRDFANEGDRVRVKLVKIDERGRYNLSMKALLEEGRGA